MHYEFPKNSISTHFFEKYFHNVLKIKIKISLPNKRHIPKKKKLQNSFIIDIAATIIQVKEIEESLTGSNKFFAYLRLFEDDIRNIQLRGRRDNGENSRSQTWTRHE